MTVSTFTQSDSTSAAPPAWGATVDGNFASGARIDNNFAPHAQTTPNMTVRLDAGHLFNGTTLTEVAAQTSATIVAPTTNPRIDRVVVNTLTGVISVITGTPSATPVPPAITAGTMPMAQVTLQTTSTSITNSMITDERVFGGSGVTGPTSSTNGSLARWNGTGGTTLEDGIPYTTTATANAIPQAGSGGTLDVSWLMGAIDGTARLDILELQLQLAISGALAASGYSSSFADAFNADTLSGVSGTTGQTYDSVNKLYSNPVGSVLITGGTNIGNMTSNGGLAAAFNGTTSQAVAASAYLTGSSPGTVGKNWGGTSNIVTACTVYGPNNVDFDTGSANTNTVLLQGSNNGSSWTTLYTWTFASSPPVNGRVLSVSSGLPATGYTYHQISHSDTGNNNHAIAQVQFYTPSSPSNMTLVSAPMSPAPTTSPVNLTGVVLYKDLSGTATLNTDVTFEATENGGTNWVLGTLADTGLTMGAAPYKVLTAPVTLSSGGTTVQWRIKALNGKTQDIKGVAYMTR